MIPNMNITFCLALLLFSSCVAIETCGDPSFQPYENDNTVNGYGGASRLIAHDELVFNKTGRVIGGTTARAHSWPWMVLLNYNSSEDGRKYICGATIISNQWLLTAGHCAEFMVISGAYAFVGIQSQRAISQSNVYNIKRKIIHPQYGGLQNDFRNDIALLQLASKLSFTKYVQPICLLSQDSNLSQPGQNGYVTGWGKYTKNDQVQIGSSPELLQAQVPIIDPDYCRRIWSTTNAQVCAGTYMKGTGQGDSGGPLKVRGSDRRWYQVGITSYGSDGNGLIDQGTYPGVYTRVSSYCKFIGKNTNGDVTCSTKTNATYSSRDDDVPSSSVFLSISIFGIFFCSMIVLWF